MPNIMIAKAWSHIMLERARFFSPHFHFFSLWEGRWF